jgi:hypothetical protein
MKGICHRYLVEVSGILLSDVVEEKTVVTFQPDINGIVKEHAQVSVVMRKTSHLFTGERFQQTLANQQQERRIDEKEAIEGIRTASTKFLAINLKLFLIFEASKTKNSQQ